MEFDEQLVECILEEVNEEAVTYWSVESVSVKCRSTHFDKLESLIISVINLRRRKFL